MLGLVFRNRESLLRVPESAIFSARAKYSVAEHLVESGMTGYFTSVAIELGARDE